MQDLLWGGGGRQHTNVGAIDEAEQIEDSHGRNHHQVNFHPQLGFCLWVKLD